MAGDLDAKQVHSYQQLVKRRVRRRLLRHAVRALTVDRISATVVQAAELSAVAQYALQVLSKMGRPDLRRRVCRELEEWIAWQSDCVGRRTPADLRVIYLCGPEPLNDLEVLLKLGIRPQNVWAIESNEKVFQSALSSTAAAGIAVKLHRGPITRFFEQVQESFDIAYLDTTGPILGGKPSALNPTLELLRSCRLSPLSALITNYAEVPANEEARYADVMTDFFRFRYNDVPSLLLEAGIDPVVAEYERDHMLRVVRSNVSAVYSDFITRLLIDIGRYWIPSARGLGVLERQYLSEKSTAIEAIASAYSPGSPGNSIEEILATIGDANLSPSSYPLISFLRSMRDVNASEPLVQQLGNMAFSGRPALELNKTVALLDHVVEGHWKLASKELLRAIAAPWFDQKCHFSCDMPFPNLIVHSLLGLYGQPSFASLRDSLRGKYVAKSTTMYSDLLVLDRCRYYFDWFPPIAQLPSRFHSEAFQVLARCLMDRIWSSDRSPDSHPFRGSSVAGFHALEAAPFHSLRDRCTWR